VIPEDCPESFKQLILDCWQLEPEKRPTAEKLVSRLKALGAEFEPYHYNLIKACERLEQLIHPKRKEALAYIPPFITERAVEGPIENYWDKWETSKEGPNPPLKLADISSKFIKSPGCSTLLLLGEAGLGKTLTTYLLADQLLSRWWAHINKGEVAPECLPIFIRPTLPNWSHKALKGAYLNAIEAYGLKGIPMLAFIDGYDEIQMDEEPLNVVEHLGLSDYNNVKLVVTCRPNTVEAKLLNERFNFKGNLQTYHFLPFSLEQLLGYLKEQLSWEETTKEAYKKTL
jgi:hypothetical protein